MIKCEEGRFTIREWLNVGTVPMFKKHNVGTVPTFKMHNIETVPTFKMHNIGTVPGTVPMLCIPRGDHGDPLVQNSLGGAAHSVLWGNIRHFCKRDFF